MIEDITDLSCVQDLSVNELEIDENNINLILTQTNYNKEEAIKKLLEHKDPLIVIKEYINPNFRNINNEKTNVSLNQQIYSQIREKFYSQKINSIKY